MHRRSFLAVVGTAAALAGCRPRHPAEAALNAGVVQAMAEQDATRQRHRAMLEGFAVPPEAERTTTPRTFDLLMQYPELKVRVRVATRLHPRWSKEPEPGESKMGGRFLWPAGEPWPMDDRTKVAYQPILQIRVEDVPATVKFPQGKDVLQLLWLPREDTPAAIKLFWRSLKEIGELAEPPEANYSHANLVPVPCRLFPENVPELPAFESIPAGELKTKLEAMPSPIPGLGIAEYWNKYLGACPGTKIGGYARRDKPGDERCEKCRFPSDYLLTVAESDSGGDPLWQPVQEKDGGEGYDRAPGLVLPSPRHVYVCRRCQGWPGKVA